MESEPLLNRAEALCICTVYRKEGTEPEFVNVQGAQESIPVSKYGRFGLYSMNKTGSQKKLFVRN
jgi:hypothetical protein